MESGIKLSTAELNVGFRNKSRTTCLFKNLNLNLKAGQLVCFMGPNGIGKSSLIRTLAGLQKPLAGKIEIQENAALPQSISVVLTQRIYGNMTARELVTFGRYPYLSWNVSLTSDDEAHIGNAIHMAEIGEIIETDISQLSDGQMQMVMIARALAQDTPIILLDEPTAHLDLNNRVQIMKLLKDLCRQMNKAILVATHELDLALQTADHIWLTGREKNILTGVPEDLVLNGSFDDIFQFKGFDLRTGRIIHPADREGVVLLTGSGHEYLWTRSALERIGFRVAGEDETIQPLLSVDVTYEEGKPRWTLKKNNRLYILSSIAELIELV
jgi:iron complex transport system ATP-binding protein